MTRFLPKSLTLASIFSLMALVVISIVLLSSVANQVSEYKYKKAALERSEEVLSAGLLGGAMPLAVTSEDAVMIESIVHGHMSFSEIYAVEVKSIEGKILYREEKEGTKDVNILPKRYEIFSPYKALDADEFEENSDQPGQVKLGTITIYFSTQSLHDLLTRQLYATAARVIISVLLCLFVVLLFKRYVGNRLALLLKLIDAIKNGSPIENYREPTGIKEITIIDQHLRSMVETLNQRDNELNNSLDEAMQASMKAKQAEEFKDEFMRAISHDIKQPVGSVLSLLSMVQDDIQDSDIDPLIKQYIDVCYRSAQALGNVTEEFFSLEQFEKATLINKPVKTDINLVFIQTLSMFQEKCNEKGISINLQNVSKLRVQPGSVFIDRNKLFRILENLVSNAVKFTNEGSIYISWDYEDEFIVIRVKDTGIGISEENISTIFDKHKQLGDISRNSREGRGLGLFYVNRLIQIINGEISVKSKEGLGSAFTVKVPFEVRMIDAAMEITSDNSSALKALIIDDDEVTCFTLQQILERQGVDASFQTVPEDGLNQILDDKPDIVFIDYHMEGMNGGDVAKKAQKLIAGNATFYCCITAESNINNFMSLEELFQVVLSKPLNMDSITQTINRVRESKSKVSKALNKLTD